MAFNQIFGDNYILDLWWTWRTEKLANKKKREETTIKLPRIISLTPKGEDIVKESVGKFTKMGFLAIAVVALLASSKRS